MNWDISVFKNVGLRSSRRLQFRVELYNAFDAEQWTGVNTNAQFNHQTGAITNPTVFGSLTDATNSARRIQLAVRLTVLSPSLRQRTCALVGEGDGGGVNSALNTSLKVPCV